MFYLQFRGPPCTGATCRSLHGRYMLQRISVRLPAGTHDSRTHRFATATWPALRDQVHALPSFTFSMTHDQAIGPTTQTRVLHETYPTKIRAHDSISLPVR